MGTVKLSPSILNADFAGLDDTFRMFERHPSVGYIHFDIMDGDFVPNIALGAPVVKSLAGKTKIPFDVHLMVSDPIRYIEGYVTENTEFIVVHAEATVHLDRTLRHIKSFGIGCGAALNPATPPESLDYVFDIVDQILVMSVNPGFGGQSFISSSIEKLRWLSWIREERGFDFKLAVDGGVDRSNIDEVVRAGADIVIVGSAITLAKDPEAELYAFDELLLGGHL